MILALLLAAAVPAPDDPVENACYERDQSQQGMNMCAGQAYERSDKALNDQWAKALAVYGEAAESKKLLLDGQRAEQNEEDSIADADARGRPGHRKHIEDDAERSRKRPQRHPGKCAGRRQADKDEDTCRKDETDTEQDDTGGDRASQMGAEHGIQCSCHGNPHPDDQHHDRDAGEAAARAGRVHLGSPKSATRVCLKGLLTFPRDQVGQLFRTSPRQIGKATRMDQRPDTSATIVERR